MANEIEKPPRLVPRIKAAPKIRQIFYCDFWRDAQLPEFWKTRPVVILSFRNTLYGHCTVVPTSTELQLDDRWAHKLSFKIDGCRESWVVCNHLASVATSRLSALPPPIPRVSEAEFAEILQKVLNWLPKPPPHAN
jgi:mRNA interferase MazF